jgi:hypothetical protein
VVGAVRCGGAAVATRSTLRDALKQVRPERVSVIGGNQWAIICETPPRVIVFPGQIERMAAIIKIVYAVSPLRLGSRRTPVISSDRRKVAAGSSSDPPQSGAPLEHQKEIGA